MGSLHRVRALAGVVSLALVCFANIAAASGEELSSAEAAQLSTGQLVVRNDDIERGGRHYIGGASYIVIDAQPVQVSAALDDVRAYRDILPRTRSVRWLGMARTGDAVLELEQGTSLVHGRFAVRVHREPAAPGEAQMIRFWMDPRYSHDIADAQGFFRVEPFQDKTLLTYVVMVDLGDGLFLRFFRERVRRVALSTPALVKTYVESHRPSS